MAVANDPPHDLSRAERIVATRLLLDSAASSSDADVRRTSLAEVAALNADDALKIVSVLYRHQQPEAIEEPALLVLALDAYTDAVLALDPQGSPDVITQVTPTLLDTVTRFSRDLIHRHEAPGIGERSGLR